MLALMTVEWIGSVSDLAEMQTLFVKIVLKQDWDISLIHGHARTGTGILEEHQLDFSSISEQFGLMKTDHEITPSVK